MVYLVNLGFLGPSLTMCMFRSLSFFVVGKTLQKMLSSDVCNLICVVHMSMCSSGSVDPSYLSKVGLFQLRGNSVSMISSVKGCPLKEGPKVLSDHRYFDVSSLVSFRGSLCSFDPIRLLHSFFAFSVISTLALVSHS